MGEGYVFTSICLSAGVDHHPSSQEKKVRKTLPPPPPSTQGPFAVNALSVRMLLEWILVPKCFYSIQRFSDRNICHYISCVSDYYDTTAPARHTVEGGSVNWVQFILYWFMRFPKLAVFNEDSVPFRKNCKDQEVMPSPFHIDFTID